MSLGIPKSRRIRLVVFAASVSFVTSLCAVRAWCRIPVPPYMVDIRDLAERSPVVFRGWVSTVNPAWESPQKSMARRAVAVFHVERWYRGNASANPSLNFTYDAVFRNGHNCIDFQPNSYWIVFAVEKAGHLELTDDCDGALAVSPLLGPHLGDIDWLAQMEADFIAGLDDADRDGRLTSIQRLGGLKLASSRVALHRVIEHGNAQESKWAIYAALRSGDVTVLPRVRQLLAKGDREAPESAIALELQNTADLSAVPDLIAILDGAPGEITRSTVTNALGDKLKDPRAVPSLSAHLSDPNSYVRFNALVGLGNITHEEACTLPPEWTESDVEPKILECKTWWEEEGILQTWTRD
jgi:hypothetical protein